MTPRAFREDLEAEEGDVTVWINSPGGNVFAAAEIYTMLCDHKGRITVKIDAIAASAASVIAMAGDRVLMSPVAMLMIHDPMTIAMGNARDMEKAITTLNEVKESIVNAYQKKTGMSRNKISQLMENETWMNAKRAVDMGFADEILFADVVKGDDDGKEVEDIWEPFSTRIMGETILNRLIPAGEGTAVTDEASDDAGVGTENVEPTEEGIDAETTVTEETGETTGENPSPEPETAGNAQPVIGLDGKTEDGGAPYQILKDKLEWLK